MQCNHWQLLQLIDLRGDRVALCPRLREHVPDLDEGLATVGDGGNEPLDACGLIAVALAEPIAFAPDILGSARVVAMILAHENIHQVRIEQVLLEAGEHMLGPT